LHRSPSIPLLALLLLAPGRPALAAEPAAATDLAPATPAATADLTLRVGEAPVMPRAPLAGWLPAIEVVGFNVAMNRIAFISNKAVYGVSLDSWGDNLRGPWWYDEDQFRTNQFAHPYQGNVYFTSARSLGQPFWTSWAYALGGSALWEWFGETEPPSVNDSITTPFAGGILGEVLFRLSNRVLDDGGERPGFWHELAATALSPANGFNRALYGNRYRPRGLNDQPFVSEFRAGVGVAEEGDVGATARTASTPLSVSIHLVNGVPGSDFAFRKPLDYYDATFALVIDRKATTSESYGEIMLRGLLLGRSYGTAPSRGVWGLYASYDYLAPPTFRAGSSNLGLGTTGQIDWGAVALQGTALIGVGFGSGGSSEVVTGFRDYHFGLQAVTQLDAKLYLWDRLRLRLVSREYFISGRASPEPDSFEDIGYGSLSFTLRVAGAHAVGVQLLGTRRTARYGASPDVASEYASASLFYELHGSPDLGRGR